MGVARVTIYGNIAGQTTNNVLHFKKEITTPAIVADLMVRVRDFFVNNPFALNTQQHQSWNRIHAFVVGGQDPPQDLGFISSGQAGVSLDYAPFVCAVFQLKTAVGGRRGRGRFYMGGFGSMQMQNGLWAPQPMVTLNACAQAIFDFWVDFNNVNYKGNGWELGIMPRGGTSADFLSLTQVVARPMVGSLRRRQIGVGV